MRVVRGPKQTHSSLLHRFTNTDRLPIFISCKGVQEKQIDGFWPVTYKLFWVTHASKNQLLSESSLSLEKCTESYRCTCARMYTHTPHTHTHTHYAHLIHRYSHSFRDSWVPYRWSRAPKLRILILTSYFQREKMNITQSGKANKVFHSTGKITEFQSLKMKQRSMFPMLSTINYSFLLIARGGTSLSNENICRTPILKADKTNASG